MKLKNPISVDDIIPLISNYKIKGNKKVLFDNASSLFDSTLNSITWVKNITVDKKYIKNSRANVFICPKGFEIPDNCYKKKCLVLVDNPSYTFLNIIKQIFSQAKTFDGIHENVIIHKDAKIGNHVYIGPFTSIGNCEIGTGSIIKSHSVVHDNVSIGRNCLISEYCNIGGQGFGHIKTKKGEFENYPHIGNVIIEDNVELFPYVNVDRATLSTTRISKGAKIDHYCHIGHNTFVGENTIITAQVVLCGGSKINKHTWLGVGSLIKDSVVVGNNVVLGMGSVVTKNIPDNETWAGVPARPLEEFIELQRKLKDL